MCIDDAYLLSLQHKGCRIRYPQSSATEQVHAAAECWMLHLRDRYLTVSRGRPCASGKGGKQWQLLSTKLPGAAAKTC